MQKLLLRRSLRLIDVVASTVPTFVPATYAITVAVNWEVLQRPRAWSPSQIFVTHGDRYELWGDGLAASSGLSHFVKTDDERLILNEISREQAAASGVVGDYLVADALAFYDDTVGGGGGGSDGSSNYSDTLVVTSSHPLVSMVASVHVGGPDWWFTGFTGVSAAVPTPESSSSVLSPHLPKAAEKGHRASGDDGSGDDPERADTTKNAMVWLDTFTVPIFPYKIGDSLSEVGTLLKDQAKENSDASAAGAAGSPDNWAKPHPHKAPPPPRPAGPKVSRVVSLVEADFNVPLAYVEFHRVRNAWEDSAIRDDGIVRDWFRALPLSSLPFILLVGAAGAGVACLGGYVFCQFVNACCWSRLRRWGGKDGGGGYEPVPSVVHSPAPYPFV